MPGVAPRVLIVDGERLIRWSLAQALRGAGCDVLETADGQGALEMADSVDVAIVDSSLPDGDGAGFAATLRRRGSLQAVILTTTDRTGELEERAARAGLDAVLEKPFELSRVLALIDDACGSA